MHRYLARRLAALLATVLAATAVAQVFLTTTVEGASLLGAVRDTPAYLFDGFVRGELGFTYGGSCDPSFHEQQCARYGPSSITAMLRERVPVDVALLLGGLVLGTIAGVLGGRRCALRPRSWSARALHGLTVFLLSCPPYFLAFMVLIWFSWNSGTLIQIPFVSGQGDYAPLTDDPLRYLKAMWMPWVLCALPLAAYVLRITDASLRDGRHEDYLRTARAKGLSERRVIDRHALPVAGGAIGAVTGVNISTLLLNVAVIEYGFGIPGLFRVLRAAVEVGDVPVMMALVIEGVILITLANFLADAVQSMLDPRIRARA